MPATYAQAPLDKVIEADGTLTCPKCRATLPVPPEDLQDLAALTRAIRCEDYDTYANTVIAINLRGMPGMGLFAD
ncbi:MAG: hypothetical protein JWP44_4516 [Mucilaginibacter sp.]|nr:hypothetical protein [Mucilaginibacter sp.]